MAIVRGEGEEGRQNYANFRVFREIYGKDSGACFATRAWLGNHKSLVYFLDKTQPFVYQTTSDHAFAETRTFLVSPSESESEPTTNESVCIWYQGTIIFVIQGCSAWFVLLQSFGLSPCCKWGGSPPSWSPLEESLLSFCFSQRLHPTPTNIRRMWRATMDRTSLRDWKQNIQQPCNDWRARIKLHLLTHLLLLL